MQFLETSKPICEFAQISEGKEIRKTGVEKDCVSIQSEVSTSASTVKHRNMSQTIRSETDSDSQTDYYQNIQHFLNAHHIRMLRYYRRNHEAYITNVRSTVDPENLPSDDSIIIDALKTAISNLTNPPQITEVEAAPQENPESGVR